MISESKKRDTATYLLHVLEAVHDEALERDALHNLVIVHLDALDGVQALDLGQQDVRVEVVVRQDQLLQLGELLQLFQVGVVHDQVEAHIDEVHLLDQVVELRPLQHLQRIAINVKHTVGFDLCVATLDEGLCN